jgi:hypothetical protein
MRTRLFPINSVRGTTSSCWKLGSRLGPAVLATPLPRSGGPIGLIAAVLQEVFGLRGGLDRVLSKAHRSLENSLATAVILRLPRFSSIALRKMLRTALTVGIDASPPPVCTV